MVSSAVAEAVIPVIKPITNATTNKHFVFMIPPFLGFKRGWLMRLSLSRSAGGGELKIEDRKLQICGCGCAPSFFLDFEN
jgi:hypothetical protein